MQAEQTKLAEIQEEFDKLLDLENKAKENVVATLPDGTVVAVPRVDSDSNTLPTENTEKNVDKTRKTITWEYGEFDTGIWKSRHIFARYNPQHLHY